MSICRAQGSRIIAFIENSEHLIHDFHIGMLSSNNWNQWQKPNVVNTIVLDKSRGVRVCNIGVDSSAQNRRHV